MDQLLTVDEVAAAYRVSKGTVRAWIRDGRLEAVTTPGRQYRIPASALTQPAA